MRSLKLALLAGAAVAALSSTAFAADLLAEPPVAPVVDDTSSWDGGYIGAFIEGDTVPSAFGLGADLGVNSLMGGLLIGGELSGTWLSTNDFSGQATGKLGAALGDAAIAYVYSGVGSRTGSSWYAPVGVGVEFKLADNLGLKTEAQYNFDLDNAGENSAAVKVGLNWHF